jgi:hypothetical protein
VENYFNYFTEIEEHFQRRWGGLLRLSPLDWVLMESWRDAGIPLEAVLRGIDVTFEHYERRPSKTRKINGLGFCSQEVLAAAEDMKEAAVGAASAEPVKPRASQGFEPEVVGPFLRRNADLLEGAKLPQGNGISARSVAQEAARTLRDLADGIDKKPARLEDLERRLTVMEEKLFAALLASTADDEIVTVRARRRRSRADVRHRSGKARPPRRRAGTRRPHRQENPYLRRRPL